ncbi:MAG TPA: cysteine rich repeat-containing protein [Nitrospira sp.]|nr:cysteine rich repeat-containing protein [Nitrospira sp.]
MKTPCRSTTPLLMLLAMLLISASLSAPDPAYSADSPKVSTNDSSSEGGQSPEQAAGGQHNLQVMRKACDEDVKKLCPDIRPGGGRILQCLHGHESSLSPACRQVLAPRSSNR